MLKTKKGSIIILLILLTLIFGIGRLFKLLEIKSVEAKEIPPLKEQLKEVRKENEQLKIEAGADLKGKILAEVRRVFRDKAKEAIMVISCENNPDKPNYDPFRININRNFTRDFGIFQINELWEKVYGGEFKRNWKANIQTAKKIFDRSGTWQHWYSSGSCHGLANK